MYESIIFLQDFMFNILDVLNRYYFTFLGIQVSLLYIIIGFLVLSMCISIFWKGARG